MYRSGNIPTSGLVFCGLISLVDPPKPDVDEAIAICKGAYVRVTMVTGDHPLTAEAIARKVRVTPDGHTHARDILGAHQRVPMRACH